MKKLLRACRNYDRQAQRKVVDIISPFLYNICWRYAGNHEDAKDLLQESLILIFNNIDKCKSDEEGQFKSWCRRIAINNALDKKRKKTIQVESLDTRRYQEVVIPKIHSKLHVEDIMRLMECLPEKQRLIFNLSVIDGYGHQEIAGLLNIKASSSRTFLTRARQMLRELIYQQEIK